MTGRNEPCPCGSGKKYKRCCGVNAAPKITTPQAPQYPAGMDPAQLDPAMMTQFAQMMGRLPKGQLQKLQSIMQRAMAGKDVTREAREFEQSLPVELQSLLSTLQMPGMPDTAAPALPEISGTPGGEMSEEEARKIVETAAKEGKISAEEAGTLLKEPKGMSKFWKNLSGK